MADEEYTGGSVSYYAVEVTTPVADGAAPYTAECQDIIDALGMGFNEGSAFKAIWRRAAARQGKRKKGYDNGLYDAEKVQFYGERMVAKALGAVSKTWPKWDTHNGYACDVVKGSRIELLHRDGTTSVPSEGADTEASYWKWGGRPYDSPTDIVGYRLL